MKDRILKNWTFIRIVYLAAGIFVTAEAIRQQQWLGALFGTYFAAMGLFGFGCAGGQCYPQTTQKSDATSTEFNGEVHYEEVK